MKGGELKYLVLFLSSLVTMLIVMGLGAFIGGNNVAVGHVLVPLVGSSLITGIVWLWDNPPSQDGEDQVTRLWRS